MLENDVLTFSQLSQVLGRNVFAQLVGNELRFDTSLFNDLAFGDSGKFEFYGECF